MLSLARKPAPNELQSSSGSPLINEHIWRGALRKFALVWTVCSSLRKGTSVTGAGLVALGPRCSAVVSMVVHKTHFGLSGFTSESSLGP